jgi:hypothetical protein
MDKSNSNNPNIRDNLMTNKFKKDSYDKFLEHFEDVMQKQEQDNPNSEIIYLINFIIDKEITNFKFEAEEDKLVKYLILLYTEYGSIVQSINSIPKEYENSNTNGNSNENIDKLNNMHNEFSRNNPLPEFPLKEINLILFSIIDRYEIKLNLINLANSCNDYQKNSESLPSIKKFLYENNIKVQNTKDYSYTIHLIFKSPLKEIKCIFEKGNNNQLFKYHTELRNKIDDVLIKSIINSKVNGKDGQLNLVTTIKNLELKIKAFLKQKKTNDRSQANQNNSISMNQPSNNLSNSNFSDSKNNSSSILENSSVLYDMKFFEEFKKIILEKGSDLTEDNYDLFENMVIKIISDKFTFAEYGNYVYLYLYDNLKKLKDPKTLETLRNKFKDNKDLNFENFEKIKSEMINYYEIRQGVLDLFLKNTSISYIESSKNIAKHILQINQSNCKENLNISGSISGVSGISGGSTNFTGISGSTTCKDVNSISKSSQSMLDPQLDKFATNFFMLIFITSKLKSLSEFDLAQNQVLNDFSLVCVSALKMNETITKASFTMNKLGDEGCWGLGRVFIYNHKLVDVDLSLNMMTDENLNSFLIGLGNSTTSLVKLNLSNNYSLTKNCGKYIAQIIEKSPYLKYLNINKNPIESGFNYISNTLLKLFDENKTPLEDLLALQIRLDSNSLKIFSEVMKHPKCTIKSLVLSENKFNNQGGSKLLRSIGKNKSLNELIVYKCEINNDLGEDLIFMLTNNRSLVSVNLFENKISDPDSFLRLISFCQGQSSKAGEILKNSKHEEEYDETFKLFPLTGNQTEQDKSFQVAQKMHTTFLNPANLVNLIHEPSERVISSNTNDDQGYPSSSNNNLKNFDLSSNKCRFEIEGTFLNIMQNVDVEMLDICKNYEDEENINQLRENEFRDLIYQKQNSNKIIY